MSEPKTKKLKTEPDVKKSDSEEQEQEEEEEEEEIECDECGRIIDEYDIVQEINGIEVCLECYERIRIDNLRVNLPDYMEVRKVSGNHQKPCSDCEQNDFDYGDWYVFDADRPWGTDKYCLECAEFRFCNFAEDSDDDY